MSKKTKISRDLLGINIITFLLIVIIAPFPSNALRIFIHVKEQ